MDSSSGSPTGLYVWVPVMMDLGREKFGKEPKFVDLDLPMSLIESRGTVQGCLYISSTVYKTSGNLHFSLVSFVL